MLFECTYADIERLNDVQLTALLRRLLHLEARAAGIPASAVRASLKVDVADGGEDARIGWEGGPANTNWIPTRLCLFQSKATDMSPAECRKEILSGRPAPSQSARQRGS